jgi:hypothetical protein
MILSFPQPARTMSDIQIPNHIPNQNAYAKDIYPQTQRTSHKTPLKSDNNQTPQCALEYATKRNGKANESSKDNPQYNKVYKSIRHNMPASLVKERSLHSIT